MLCETVRLLRPRPRARGFGQCRTEFAKRACALQRRLRHRLGLFDDEPISQPAPGFDEARRPYGVIERFPALGDRYPFAPQGVLAFGISFEN